MGTPYRAPDVAPSREDTSLATAQPRDLGRLRSVHASATTTTRFFAGATGIAIVLAVLTIAWPAAPLVVASALAAAVALAMWGSVASALGLDLAVEVHERGIVLRRSWRRAASIRFDDVTSVHLRPGVTDTPFVFVLADGRRVALPTRLSDRPRLVAAVESAIERPVLDDALRALASGEVLTFGPLRLELDGIRHHDDLLPWAELDRVHVTDVGFVFISKPTQHAFVVVATRDVPFPRVLVALLARRTRVETDDPFWMRWVRP